MAVVVLDREISCPIDRVFAYHTDLSRASEYWANLIRCRRLDGQQPGVAVGTAYAWRYAMVGREFEGHFTVRELVPLERFSFEIGGAISGRITHEYRATAATRTYVVVTVRYEVPMGVFGKAVDRFFVEQRNVADGRVALDRLETILERGHIGAPAATADSEHQCRPPQPRRDAREMWACPHRPCALRWRLAFENGVAYWRPLFVPSAPAPSGTA